ncbi:MAG: hypothetical protein SFW67_31610 [Myxococcaceae bacterium]|nr:hypothetical protein [Myxococcaceae bacterium]
MHRRGSRVQYVTGPSALALKVGGRGRAAGSLASTSLVWAGVDVTRDRASWSVDDVRALTLRVSLAVTPSTGCECHPRHRA